MLGWEPKQWQERVYEYDAWGRPRRLLEVVTHTEVEWDDAERAKMMALAEYEGHICECGFHESVADTDPDLELDLRRCPVCAGIAQQMRQLTAQDEKETKELGGGKDPAPLVPRPDDGRHVRLKRKMPKAAQTPTLLP